MKKLLVLAAVVAMGAMGAKAEYDAWLGLNLFVAAKGDTNPARENLTEKGYYKAFIINYSGEQTIDKFVESSTVDYIGSITKIHYDYSNENNDYSMGQYWLSELSSREGSYGLDIEQSTAYMIVYYMGGADTPSEYIAMANYSAWNGAVAFDDSEAGTTTGWHAYTVPEPTSALLMLLGMAGVALKRKVA